MKPTMFFACTCLIALSNASATETTCLDRINVTATRTARTVDQTLAPVEVITRTDIERSQAKDLLQLLSGFAGIDITRQGGYGQVSSLFLRGTSAYQSLVLIDGIRVGSATLGVSSLQTIPISQVERIEIVRGPRSSLYGADVIGGVIHVFTRQGGSVEQKPSISATYGSHDTRDVSASFGVGSQSIRFGLNLAHFATDGIDALKDNNPDKDGHRNDSLSTSFRYELGKAGEINLQLFHNQGNTEYDNPFDPVGDYEEDFLQQTLSSKLVYRPVESWDSTLSLGLHRDESRLITNDLPSGDFNTRRVQTLWQNDITLKPDQLLTVGLEMVQESVDVDAEYTDDNRRNKAVFLQHQMDLLATSLSLGLRRDENDAFGDYNTGNISLGYELTPSLRLIASYASAFRAPTFNDLYYQDRWGMASGNPDLASEKSRNTEFGLTGKFAWGDWELRLFQNDIRDLIQWEEVATYQWEPQNVAEARIRGFETKLKTRVAGWDLSGNLTLLEPKDRETDLVLPRRSRQTFRLDVDRVFGATELGVSLVLQGQRYDDAANTISLGGYGLTNLQASHRITESWLINGQIKNLFDKQYETAKGYNNLGRELLLSIVFSPDI